MTDQQSPQAVECLPVYAWLNPEEPFAIDARMKGFTPHFFSDCTEPLIRRSDAQATIDALRAEVARLNSIEPTSRAGAILGQMHSEIDALRTELATLRSRALDVDAVMALAEKLVAAELGCEEGNISAAYRDAARAALLAKLKEHQ